MFDRGPNFSTAPLVLRRVRNREILEWIYESIGVQIGAGKEAPVRTEVSPIAALQPGKCEYSGNVAVGVCRARGFIRLNRLLEVFQCEKCVGAAVQCRGIAGIHLDSLLVIVERIIGSAHRQKGGAPVDQGFDLPRTQGKHPIETPDALLMAAKGAQRIAAICPGLDHGRIRRNRGIEARKGLRGPIQSKQNRAAIGQCLNEIRHERYRLVERRQRACEVIFARQTAPVHERRRGGVRNWRGCLRRCSRCCLYCKTMRLSAALLVFPHSAKGGFEIARACRRIEQRVRLPVLRKFIFQRAQRHRIAREPQCKLAIFIKRARDQFGNADGV